MRRRESLKLLRMKEVARRVYVLRVSKNLTLDELEKATGISRGRLSKFENAKILPRLDDLFVLAEVLDVRASYFFDMARAPKLVPVYPSLRELVEMLSQWVDSRGPESDLPMDLIRALRDSRTQEKVRSFLRLNGKLPREHLNALAGIEAAKVATVPPVTDLTHATHPLGESLAEGDGGE